MKTCIYYFSGTGNSLAAATRICEGLGDCELVSIASLAGSEAITPDAGRVGIVCPVYDFGLPAIVADFSGRLDARNAQYLFAVITFGGAGRSALKQLDGILKSGGRGLDAAFSVAMPGNFPTIARPPEGRKRDEILAKADAAIEAITEGIRSQKRAPPGPALITSLLRGITYPPFIRNVHGADEKFWLTDACTSCGICERVCPVKNIDLVDGRPEWHHRCQLCMACLHFCPVEAIQWGGRTEHRGRYRHPNLTVQDMERQQG